MSNFYRPSPPVSDTYIAKWDRSVLREGFVPFPKRLMRCLREVFSGESSLGQLQIVLAISDSKRLGPFRPPTIDFLAYNAGMEVGEFQQYILELRREGLISVLDDDPKHFDVDLSPLLHRIETLTPEGS